MGDEVQMEDGLDFIDEEMTDNFASGNDLEAGNDSSSSSSSSSSNSNNSNQSNPAGWFNSSFSSTIASSIAYDVYNRGSSKAKELLIGGEAAESLSSSATSSLPLYFDLPPSILLSRLMYTITPGKSPIARLNHQDEDLYGPTMIIFTLASLVLLASKISVAAQPVKYISTEKTLLGSALFVCFSFWITVALLHYFLKFIFNARLSFIQIVSLVGYSQFATVLCMFVHCFFPSLDFYAILTVGSLSALVIGLVFLTKAPKLNQGAAWAIIAAIIQLLFICYLVYSFSAFPTQKTAHNNAEPMANNKNNKIDFSKEIAVPEAPSVVASEWQLLEKAEQQQQKSNAKQEDVSGNPIDLDNQ